MNKKSSCFNCGKTIRGDNHYIAHTEQGQNVIVGPDCYNKITGSGWASEKNSVIIFPGDINMIREMRANGYVFKGPICTH